MKLNIPQAALRTALSKAARFVAARMTLPILESLHFNAAEGELMISATNLEAGVQLSVPAQVQQAGAICLPARIVLDLVASLAAADVSMQVDEKTLSATLTSAGSKTCIKGFDPDEFPPTPQCSTGGIRLPAAEWKRAIQSVVFAASPDPSRPILTGVQFGSKEGNLTLAASDGFRLALSKIELEADCEQQDVLVPAAALRLLLPLLDGGPISMAVSDRQAIFGGDDWRVAIQLIEAQFPDWQQIVPKNTSDHLTVASADFIAAIKQADVIARDASHIGRLECSDGMLAVRAESLETGNALASAPAEGSLAATIAFNLLFLKQSVEAIGGEKLIVDTNAADTPAVVRPAAANGRLHLIMPLKFDDAVSAAAVAEAAEVRDD